MKEYKLIMLDSPVIVSNEDVKEGDYGVIGTNIGKIIFTNDESFEFEIGPGVVIQYSDYQSLNNICKLIVAGLKDYHTINWNGLEKEFGIVNIKSLANEKYKTLSEDLDLPLFIEPSWKGGFKKGFNTAESLNDKKYTFEDMVNFYLTCTSTPSYISKDAAKSTVYQFIKELENPKIYSIEAEEVIEYAGSNPGGLEVFSMPLEYSYKILKKL